VTVQGEGERAIAPRFLRVAQAIGILGAALLSVASPAAEFPEPPNTEQLDLPFD
jgi:hypothetical protein